MASSDPYVDKASQDATPEQKIKEVQEIIAATKTAMLVSQNANGNLHARAMAPSSKEGLVFDFLANNNSGKFDELKANKNVNISFFNTSSDWASISGQATVSSDTEKIKSLWHPAIKSWFGDLGDGVHTGEATDPRISIIEVVPNEIRYWKQTSSSVSTMFQVAKGAVTGQTAAPGVLRQLDTSDLALARAMANK